MKNFEVEVPTSDAMRVLGTTVASFFISGDVVLLSGPLGAGKTTFAQGVGAGLGITEPVVSPTFTIARELEGTYLRLIHVDAYRIGGVEQAPGSDSLNALLDELESLGLDEELENPSEDSVVLMEWGEQMAGILSSERLEIDIDRHVLQSGTSGELAGEGLLTSAGVRTVRFTAVGDRWEKRFNTLRDAAENSTEYEDNDHE